MLITLIDFELFGWFIDEEDWLEIFFKNNDAFLQIVQKLLVTLATNLGSQMTEAQLRVDQVNN